MPDKLDFSRVMKPYWRPPVGAFEIVEVPELAFILVDGQGDPNGAAFAEATGWLYPVAYALKFASKADGRDYGVAPLEGLWWADDLAAFGTGSRADWKWTAMIMQPDWTTPEMFRAAVTKTEAKQKRAAPPSLRLGRFAEGLSVQTMHVGPYATEAPTIARLHAEFLPANGLVETGHHHEIYFGDPRRTAPEKLKTIIRQPVKRRT